MNDDRIIQDDENRAQVEASLKINSINGLQHDKA